MSLTLEPTHTRIPRLEMGDHLDRATFHSRYQAMPPGIKAELIDGVVFMPSPAKKLHGSLTALLNGWLTDYQAATPGVEALDNTSVVLSETSEPQPDASLIIRPECGGQTTEDEEGWVIGAPELVVEVASTTAAYDLHRKKQVFEEAGGREYLVVITEPPGVFWFVLRERRYVELSPGQDGLFRSETFPGLWLNPQSLLDRDPAGLKSVLQQGLASREHAAFVERLKAAAS